MIWTTTGAEATLWSTNGTPVFGGGGPESPPRTDPALLTSLRQVADNSFKTPTAATAAVGGATAVHTFTFTAPAIGVRAWITGANTGLRAALVIRGIAYRVTVGGSETFSVPAGAGVVTDPLPEEVWTEAGMTGQLRLYVPEGGAIWQAKAETPTSGILSGDRTLLVDTPPGPGRGSAPFGIIGKTLPTSRAIFLDGDSILTTPWARGAAVDNGIAYVDRGEWGIQINAFTAPLGPGGVFPHPVWDYFLWELGTNNTGQTQPQVFQQAITAMYVLADAGMAGVQTTLLPRTTSTDAWATVENQTPANDPAWREAWNAWVRDGSPVTAERVYAPPGSTSVLRAGDDGHMLAFPCCDTASAVETGTSASRVWKAGKLTTDGSHLTAAGDALLYAYTQQWMSQNLA